MFVKINFNTKLKKCCKNKGCLWLKGIENTFNSRFGVIFKDIGVKVVQGYVQIVCCAKLFAKPSGRFKGSRKRHLFYPDNIIFTYVAAIYNARLQGAVMPLAKGLQ